MSEASTVLDALLGGADDEGVWDAFEALGREARSEVARGLKARVDELVRSRPPDSLPVAEHLVRAARGLGELEALALRGRALARAYNGRLDEARTDYEAAAVLYDEHGPELEGARVRRSLVEVHHLGGRTADALACAELARDVFERHGERRLLAQLEVNVGNVHTRRDEYPLARTHYLRARELFAAEGDELGHAIAEFDLAVVEMNDNRVAGAAEALRAARARFETAGATMWVADCDYTLAYLESRGGEYSLAIAGLGRAREAYEQCGKPSGVPLCDLDLAEIWLALDARRDALSCARRAASRFEELGLTYEGARAAALEGLAHARLGDHGEAEQSFLRAEAAFRAVDNQAAARALAVQRAALELAAGRTRGAAHDLEQLGLALAASGQAQLADLACATLGRALLMEGRATRALDVLATLTTEEPGRVRDPLLLAEAESLMARALRELGRTEEARGALARAIEFVEQTWVRVPGRDVRLAFFRERHTAYVELAWLLSDSGEQDATLEALCVLERGRFRSLRDVPPAFEGQQDELDSARQHLDWLLGRRLAAELDGTERDHELRLMPPQEDELLAARRAVVELARTQGQRADARPTFSLADLERARGANDALLVYLASERGLRAFVSTDDSTRVVELDLSLERLIELRDRLLLQLDKLQLPAAYLERHATRLARAADALLDELGARLLAPCLEGLDPEQALVVAPYGELHNLPFHAFRVGGEPVAAQRELSYALGLHTLARLREPERAPAEGALLLAGGAADLEGVNRELEALQALYGERACPVEADEVVAGFPSGLEAGCSLHIAAHGRFEPDAPAFSAISVGERFLLAHDVQRRSLPLELVCLSGCETGRGRRIAGEELLGLTGALHTSGVRSVLASLWPVEDSDALAFMSAFHRAMEQGQSARGAVRSAQSALRQARPHAHSWAAFALTGDPDLRLGRAHPPDADAIPR